MPTVTESKLAHAIDRVYAATVDPGQWNAALSELTALFGGQVTTLELHDVASRQVVFFDSLGVESHTLEAYQLHYAEVSPRVRHLHDTDVGSVHCDYEFFTERDIERSEFYQDFLAPLDLKYFISTTLVEEGNRHGAFSVHRASRLGHMDEDEIVTMRALVPHLTRALAITTRLHEQEAGLGCLREALSRISTGVALIDARRRVVYINDAARAALGPQAPLIVRDGLLSARRRLDRTRLSAFVEAAIRGTLAPSTMVVGGEAQNAISVSICRLPSLQTMDTLLTRPPPEAWLAMLVFEPIQSARAALRPLQDLGLGLAEARLAVALADGESLAQYAARHGVSINTVRTHLARIRGKLDCRTQADVVRRVLQLLPRTLQKRAPPPL